MIDLADRGQFMQTYLGLHFYPADPRPEEICIEDIAHHLSLVNRFNGVTSRPYSVAQHCINCALVAQNDYSLEALLHDASEAYIADINSPTKHYLPDYKVLEARLYRVIAQKFGFPLETTSYVRHIDAKMLVTEASYLMRPGSYAWWKETHWPEPYDLDTVHMDPLAPEDAEEWFLDLFEQCKGDRQ